LARFTDKQNRPVVCDPDFSRIPAPLTLLRQWVMWKFDWKDGGGQAGSAEGSWAKVPYQPDGRHARSNDPATWYSFADCLRTFETMRGKFDGVGFMFSDESPYMGVDLDYCVTHDEDMAEYRLTPFAARVIEKLGSYSEFSPSKTGIHIIGEAGQVKALKTKIGNDEIELYSSGRYFTFTGLSWHEDALETRGFHSEVTEIIEGIKKAQQGNLSLSNGGFDLEKRLRLVAGNANASRLFNGDISEYGDDDSRADLALCNHLVYYADGNLSIADSMFRRSRLMRPKWDERRGAQTYGELTLEKAGDGGHNHVSVRKETLPPVFSYETRKRRRFTVDDLWESAMAYRTNPLNGGVDPGWDNLNKLYRPRKGLFSVVTGEPGSGKSTFVDCLAYNIAGNHQWKILFASFETQPLERHVLDLCQIYLQKPTFSFADNAATDDEMEEARGVINQNFFFMMPDESELTMEPILDYVDDEIREHGISGFVLDPFSELDTSRDFRQQQTDFIEKNLRRLRSFTRHRDIHTWLIAHPTKSGETYKDGRPTLRSISGSAHFYNKADYGVVVDRDDNDITTVHIDKVRFSETGQGKTKASFTYNSNRRSYDPLEAEL
jgi:hypothetical protein